MNNYGKVTIMMFVAILFLMNGVKAQNPIIQTNYTADPAPVVINNTLFLYVGQDEDSTANDSPGSYLMRCYRLYTTTDMVNWTDCGAPLRTSYFEWSAGDASAAECIERNGKYYWYVSTLNKYSPGVSVGVAVADSPYGPFEDALGHALVTNDMTKFADHAWDDLDPTVFIDDNGQAYLFWGNGACYWAKLNKDMISIDGEIHALDVFDKSAFGASFTEAPWVYKRNGKYYLIYASGFPESIHYTISSSPKGPWRHKGEILPFDKNSATIHPGIVDYKGNSYFFYHNAALPGGHDKRRSVCVEQFEYNEDGTIPTMVATEGIVQGVEKLNPYIKTEAETIAWAEGVKTAECKDVGVYVTSVHNGDYIKVRDVDFGEKGAEGFTASVASRYYGGTIELRIGGVEGELIGELNVPYTGEWYNWQLEYTEVENVKGVHDLYFVFMGGEPYELLTFDYWVFSEAE